MLPFVDKQKLKGKRKKEALLVDNNNTISNDIERPIQEYRCYLVPGDTVVELTASRDQAFEGQARWAWNTLKPVYDVRQDKINKWIEVRLSYRSEMIQQDFRFIIEMMRKMQDSEFYAYSVVLERLQWLTNQYRIEQDWRESEDKREIMKSLIAKSNNSKKCLEGAMIEEKSPWEINNELRKAEIKRKAQLRAALEAKELEFDLFAKIELPQILSRLTRGELFYSAIIYNCAQGLLHKKTHSLIFSNGSTEVLQGSQKRFLASIMRRGWGDPTAAAERRASTLYQIMQFSDVLQQQIISKEEPSVDKFQAGMAVQMLLQGQQSNSNNKGSNSPQSEGIKMMIQQMRQQQNSCSPAISSVNFQQNMSQQQQQSMQRTLSQSMQQFSQCQSQREISGYQLEQYEQSSQNSFSGQQVLMQQFQQLQQQQQQQQNIPVNSFKSSFSLTTNEMIKDKQKDNVFTKEISQQNIIQQVLPFKLLGMSQARVEVNEGISGGQDTEMRLFDGYSIFGKMRDVTVFKYSGNEVIGMATIYTFEMPEGATEALKESRQENNRMNEGDLEDRGDDIEDMNQFEYNLQVKKFFKKFNIQVQSAGEKEGGLKGKEDLIREQNKCDVECDCEDE